MLYLNTQAARQATADLARSALPDAPQVPERARPVPRSSRVAAARRKRTVRFLPRRAGA